MLEKNLENFPKLEAIGKWLKDNKNDFLSSIYNNAQKWVLSDRQIEAAQKAWERAQKGDDREYVIFDKKRTELWIKIINDLLPASNYYNNNDFQYDMLAKIEQTGKLTLGQFAPLQKKILKYKKSILKKIFK